MSFLKFFFLLCIFITPFVRTVDTNEAWLLKGEFLGAVAAIFMIILFLRKREIIIPAPKILKPYIIFLLLIALRSIFSKNPGLSSLSILLYSLLPIIAILAANIFSIENSKMLFRILRMQLRTVYIAFFVFYFNIPQSVAEWRRYGTFDLKTGIDFKEYFPFYNENFTSIYVFIGAVFLF